MIPDKIGSENRLESFEAELSTDSDKKVYFEILFDLSLASLSTERDSLINFLIEIGSIIRELSFFGKIKSSLVKENCVSRTAKTEIS